MDITQALAIVKVGYSGGKVDGPENLAWKEAWRIVKQHAADAMTLEIHRQRGMCPTCQREYTVHPDAEPEILGQARRAIRGEDS